MNSRFVCFTLFMAAAAATSSFTFSRPLPVQQSGVQARASVNQAPAKLLLDKAHSNVTFTVTHMLVTETEGSFKTFDGVMEYSKPDLSDARIVFTVNVNSINTDNANRDKHLKSDDFFNTQKYPLMKFTSTAFTPAGENKYTLTGMLTIRDVSRPVTFNVAYGGSTQDKGATRTIYKATTTINRFDYGLKWDKATETGGMIVSKEVAITINAAWRKA